MENMSLLMAFIAGFLIFLSPCVLPLVPAYISYLTGISFREIEGGNAKEERKKIRRITILHSLGFIAGFSVVFVLLGASVTLLGQLLFQHQAFLKKLGGALIIFFAFIIMGAIKMPILSKEKKFSYRKTGVSLLGSVLVGATFAAAWTPCVGPILGSILIYASSAESVKKGIALLSAFSLGLGLPFFLSALIVNSLFLYIKKIEKYMRWIKIAAGIILIIFGTILLSGNAHAESKKAPDFELKDINGRAFKLSDYSGRVIILNFFATWCPPCRAEMPDFNEISKEYANSATVIAISAGGETLPAVQKFVGANALNFTVAMDDGNASALYGPISAIPVTVIIDKNFNIAKRYIGQRSKGAFIKDIEELSPR